MYIQKDMLDPRYVLMISNQPKLNKNRHEKIYSIAIWSPESEA